MNRTPLITGIGMALAALTLMAAPAYAGNSTPGTKISVLTCNALPETGVGFGIDFRVDRERQLVFTVFAADVVSGSHKLAGKYGGAGTSASLGVGAQVLVGGSNRSISLQSVIEGSTGVGVSAGIIYLYLQPK